MSDRPRFHIPLFAVAMRLDERLMAVPRRTRLAIYVATLVAIVWWAVPEVPRQ